MTLNINRNYTRSVNIERDILSKDVSANYIPTARSLYVIDRLVKTINLEDKTRSWTLVGPYGSGKSSFGLFLSTILGESTSDQNVQAMNNLKQKDEELAMKLFASTKGNTKGFLRVILTGSPEPIAEAFVKALKSGIERFWSQGKRPNFYKKICSWKSAPSTSTIVEIFREIQNYLEKKQPKCKGILIVVDELGKFLEYEARHQGDNDIYFLQALAEHAYRGSAINLYVFTLTHQSFEKYAPGLNKIQQEEWAKIQGRFESIPFVEPVEQTLEVVSKALNSTSVSSAFMEEMNRALKILKDQRALPTQLGIKAARDLFTRCYPLHPLTALFLPMLCQKVAQNERTLFNFIGSDEPFGLKDCVLRQGESDPIYIYSLYDYFIENQTANILDHYTHRRWAEVTSAIARLGEASAEETFVLKTIGLINIIGSQGGIKASREILSISTPFEPSQLEAIISNLISKSLIHYRKFNNEYRVWQGSDFDIEETLAYELDQLRSISVSEYLNKQRYLPNIVANKHSIETGTFRYYTTYFIEESSMKVPKECNPKILIYLAKKGENKDSIIEFIKPSLLEVVGIFFEQEKIKNSVAEIYALQQILNSRNELNSDPVASHEFKDRIIAAKERLNSQLQLIIQHPEKGIWFRDNHILNIFSKRELNSNLSEILTKEFRKSPIIKNELINQDVPSAQAVTARNKLMQSMLANEHLKDLGIEKYPAEKAIYKSTLLATGIHKLNEDSWAFGPPPEEDPFNMRDTWDCIVNFLHETDGSPKPFTALNQKLKAHPYGIKEGVLPILYLSVFLYFKHQIALYENGSYLPILPPERHKIFIKRMDLFAVQLVKIEGINSFLYESYAKLFKVKEKGNPQELIKPFAQFVSSLPGYVKNTRTLSPCARDIITSYDRANSPQDLLFNLLPKACGLRDLTRESMDNFFANFREGLVEIRDAYDNLLKSLVFDISSVFSIESKNLHELRNKLSLRFLHLTPYANGSSHITSALSFLTSSRGHDSEWLERFLAYLAQKKPITWKDSDVSQAKTELRRIAHSLIDLEKIYLDSVGDKYLSNENNRMLLKTVKPGVERDSIVFLDEVSLRKTYVVRNEVRKILNSVENSSLRLTTLASIVDEELSGKNDE